jgi:hypothetical protein
VSFDAVIWQYSRFNHIYGKPMHKIFVTLFAFAFLILLASPAHARRGIPLLLFFNTGDEMFEAGKFTSDMLREFPDLAGFQPAYMCKRFGLFGADVWTWDCHMVAGQIAAESYADLPDGYAQRLQAEYPMSKANRGFWNHYGILGLLGLPIGWNFIKNKMSG